MLLDDRDHARLVFGQEADHLVGAGLADQFGEAAHVQVEDRRVPHFAGSGADLLLRALDPGGDLGVEEARQLTSRRLLRHRPHQEAFGPLQGHGDDAGHQQDRDHLVEFGAQQDGVGGHVGDVIAGDHGVRGVDGDDVDDHDAPAGGRDDARQQHEAGLEPEGAQRDEYEDVEQRRRLQVERRGLLILQMEAPDQNHQQCHVEDHRNRQRPVGQPSRMGPQQPDQSQQKIDRQGPGHGGEVGVFREGLGGYQVEGPEGHDDEKLEPSDQNLAFILLGADLFADPGRQAICLFRRPKTLPAFDQARHDGLPSCHGRRLSPTHYPSASLERCLVRGRLAALGLSRRPPMKVYAKAGRHGMRTPEHDCPRRRAGSTQLPEISS